MLATEAPNILGIDVGGKYRIITSTGRQYKHTNVTKLVEQLMIHCQSNGNSVMGIENPDCISTDNRNTRDILRAIIEIAPRYDILCILVDPIKSSRICHRCNNENTSPRVLYRAFTCKFCNLSVSSDYNAAMNIKNRAMIRYNGY